MTDNSTGKLIAGIVLLTSFAGVMFLIFMPLFDGANALNYMDNLYNSISKGSAYYIPKMTHLIEEHPDRTVQLNLKLGDAGLTERARVILESSGAAVTAQGDGLQVSGEITSLLEACLRDSELAYRNRGDELTSKYGMAPRSAIHAWWSVLGAAERDLNRQKLFPEAQLVHAVQTKAVECSYNYYGIEPGRIGERWGIVLFSLVFYVIYTVWYGYGIMFLFEGLGFRLAH
jgi:hypothetical protein